MTQLVCRYVDATTLTTELLRELAIEQTAALEIHLGDPDRETLRRLVADADIVLNGHTFMDAGILASAPRLQSIIFLGSGASSYIDMDAARARRIMVRTISGYGDRAVAEHTIALLLAAARGVAIMDRSIRNSCWDPVEGLELGGRTLGVVGLGGIGREMVRISAAFGMRVLAWSRSAPTVDLPCEFTGLDDVLAQADAVSLHLALTPDTRGLIDGGRIAAMRPGAILVNTARAGLVDTAAMLDALRSGHLRHAALDVFDMEPLPDDHSLKALPNVTLSAHAAFKTREASRNLLVKALALLDHERGLASV